MKPVPFAQQNAIIQRQSHEDPAVVHDVPCFLGEHAIAACFEISDEEIEQLKSTNRFWVIVGGTVWPNLAIQNQSPITNEDSYDFPEEIEYES